MVSRLTCPAGCGIFLDQGSNPCPLHWQADSLPLSHQGSPPTLNCFPFFSFLSSSWMWSGISLRFDLHFSNLLWRNVFSNSACYLIGLSSCCLVVSVLYSDTRPLSNIWFANTFLHSVVFISLSWQCPLMHKYSKFWQSLICLFLLLLIMLLISNLITVFYF